MIVIPQLRTVKAVDRAKRRYESRTENAADVLSGLKRDGRLRGEGMRVALAGIVRKQQREWILLDVGGQLIENPLEMFFWAGVPFFEGMEHGH